MTMATAVSCAESIAAWAVFIQSIELLARKPTEKRLALARISLCLLLFFHIKPLWVVSGLLLTAFILLKRFRGPYNGGSDRMTLLVLMSLWCFHAAPSVFLQELALGYLSVQLVLSYFQSGWVKIVNADWRRGRALCDVFVLTVYPVSEHVRQWSQSPRLLWVMSWLVILFELVFPLALLNTYALWIALSIAALFHFANATLFGLNRFFWIWPAAYPILLWFQGRFVLPLISF